MMVPVFPVLLSSVSIPGRFSLSRSGRLGLHGYSRTRLAVRKNVTMFECEAPRFRARNWLQGGAANAAARCEFFLSRMGIMTPLFQSAMRDQKIDAKQAHIVVLLMSA